MKEFSFRTRERSLQRFQDEVFDVLIIGGGITGAAVARDASSRGLKVALVERMDFAFGTSSRSSKLIHGGLRYLQNLEFGLVFEALSERSHLLKTAPHMVKPLPFYFPVYRGDSHGRILMSFGLWLYDLLALFRAPGLHKGLSRKQFLEEVPFLKTEGLRGGFRFYDASMWDDVLVIETLKAAQEEGAVVANYIEASEPVWDGEQIIGFKVKGLSGNGLKYEKECVLRAHHTIVCAGPWADQVGAKLSKTWKRWLTPSKGVHLVFDLKRIPLPGAFVMSHPKDGRVAFVIPRTDLGDGVVIVGTTDGPTQEDLDQVQVSTLEVEYLMELLNQYFPTLQLTPSDILSSYVGIRPLMGGSADEATVLQKVSREHHIDQGPGGTGIVAGGKYTTHRTMAREVVDFGLKFWKKDSREIGRSQTDTPVNPQVTVEAIQKIKSLASDRGLEIPEKLLGRYGGDALSLMEMDSDSENDPAGFPYLKAQLRYSIRSEMVLFLEDFYLRRVPLYATRKDHGLPWANALAEVWAEEQGLSHLEVQAEVDRLQAELAKRSQISFVK